MNLNLEDTKNGLPLFNTIKIENIISELESILEKCRNLKHRLLKEGHYTWNDFIFPLDT